MNILFINMPFGAIRPAIGLGLLKSHLERIGVASRVLYLNMRFARVLGSADYNYLAQHAPSQSLAGEWVFARGAFGQRDEADWEYLQAFSSRFGNRKSSRSGMEALLRARTLADQFVEDCLHQEDWASYDVIGFSSTFSQNVASLWLARRIKELFPKAIIVFGGANCEAEMGLQLHRSFTFIDYVCGGEADLSFPRLVQELTQGDGPVHIPGVISRLDGESQYSSLTPERIKNLDDLPFPDYGDYFEQLGEDSPSQKGLATVLMESSRGCWWGEKHHCTFCGLNGTSMAFRSKSPSRVLEEITYLSGKYQASSIEMVDNILDMKYFHDLIPEMQKRKLNLGLFYETKANLTKDQIRALRDAGVRSIQPGIESLSTEILRIMRKGTNAAKNLQVLKWCKELGVDVAWNIIYGFPGENPTEYEEMARIVGYIQHLQPPAGFSSIRLDRFSPNFAFAKEFGFSNVRPDRSYGYVYGTGGQELKDLAYFFEHDYVDNRNPRDYVAGVEAAVRQWQHDAPRMSLTYKDDGVSLVIADSRFEGQEVLTSLEGSERDLYLFCDQSRTIQQLEQFLSTQGAIDLCLDRFLQRLVAAKLMVKLDAGYLSTAVKIF